MYNGHRAKICPIARPRPALFKTHAPPTLGGVNWFTQGLLRPRCPARQKWSLPRKVVDPESNVAVAGGSSLRPLHRLGFPRHLLEGTRASPARCQGSGHRLPAQRQSSDYRPGILQLHARIPPCMPSFYSTYQAHRPGPVILGLFRVGPDRSRSQAGSRGREPRLPKQASQNCGIRPAPRRDST